MKEKTPIQNKNLPEIKEAPPGIARTEQEAWQNMLGTRVEVKPLPDSVTPDVRRNLEGMGFNLRYVPALNIGNADDLREGVIDGYLNKLQQRYPRWKPLERLTFRERADHSIPRNLDKWFWKLVKDGDIDFPVLPGQWMAVETLDKPSFGQKYARTPLAEKLGFNDRFNKRWDSVKDRIDSQKGPILAEVGLTHEADLRLLEALEWNLLGNREGWGRTNTYEWTNTEYRGFGVAHRLIVGDSDSGGAADVRWGYPGRSVGSIGFRAAVVLGS